MSATGTPVTLVAQSGHPIQVRQITGLQILFDALAVGTTHLHSDVSPPSPEEIADQDQPKVILLTNVMIRLAEKDDPLSFQLLVQNGELAVLRIYI